MKLLISLCLALAAGCFLRGMTLVLEGGKRPSGDFMTLALKGFVKDFVLPYRLPWIEKYIRHISPILQEVPLPPTMDLNLFLGLHLACAILLGATAAYLCPGLALILFPAGALLGAGIPYGWLLQQRKKFHHRLLKAMPEWLELLSLVMEAGLDLSAGIQQYLEKGTPGPLQTLLAVAHKETQMGCSRSEAMSALAQRTSFGPLREICRSLVQALSLGGSLAPLLREQSSMLRTKRMQIAEKKAAEAPLKVLIPLFLFITPTVFIVLFGPLAMQFARGGF